MNHHLLGKRQCPLNLVFWKFFPSNHVYFIYFDRYITDTDSVYIRSATRDYMEEVNLVTGYTGKPIKIQVVSTSSKHLC